MSPTVLAIVSPFFLTLLTLWIALPLKKVYKGRRTQEGGFTVIELMCVLAILGILAAIAIPVYFDNAGGDKQSRGEEDMRKYISAHFPNAIGLQDTRVTCAIGMSSRYARCTANVMVADGKYQLVEAECGVSVGTKGCGPVRGVRN